MRRARRLLVLAVLLAGLGGAPPEPVFAAPGAERSDWRMVSAGSNHTCAIRTSGRLFCWGSDGAGQLGNGATTGSQTTPDAVAGGGLWSSVTAGTQFTCGVRTTGRLYCWGIDNVGQLGNGATLGFQTSPFEVAGGATNWTRPSAGHFHACARRTTGRLYCWGQDDYGQLGNGGANVNRDAPAQVAGGATNWSTVRAGGFHACAMRTTRQLYCWGRDLEGQLGNGGLVGGTATPGLVTTATNWASVDTGLTHTCGRRTSGRLFCWGSDGQGRLGDDAALAAQGSPAPVAGTTRWTAVTTGESHTCARATNGRLWCWGSDGNGELGDGAGLAEQHTPVGVAGADTDWTAVDAGTDHTCARTTSGRLLCWGANAFGQLGNGTSGPNRPVPDPVL